MILGGFIQQFYWLFTLLFFYLEANSVNLEIGSYLMKIFNKVSFIILTNFLDNLIFFLIFITILLYFSFMIEFYPLQNQQILDFQFGAVIVDKSDLKFIFLCLKLVFCGPIIDSFLFSPLILYTIILKNLTLWFIAKSQLFFSLNLKAFFRQILATILFISPSFLIYYIFSMVLAIWIDLLSMQFISIFTILYFHQDLFLIQQKVDDDLNQYYQECFNLTYRGMGTYLRKNLNLQIIKNFYNFSIYKSKRISLKLSQHLLYIVIYFKMSLQLLIYLQKQFKQYQQSKIKTQKNLKYLQYFGELYITPTTISTNKMIIPVRCFSCGKVIAHKWQQFQDQIAHLDEDAQVGKILDKMGFKRYCCRRMFLSHVDLIDKLLNYNIHKSAENQQ